MPGYGDSLTSYISPADLSSEKAGITSLLTAPAPVYTPELTSGALDLIQRRAKAATDTNVANLESDIMARGGSGSSSEYQGLAATRAAGDQTAADQALQFLLGAADASAKNRQFNASLGLDIYKTDTGVLDSTLGRQFSAGQQEDQQAWQTKENEIQRQWEQTMAQQYMDVLNAMKKKAKRGQIASGITGLVGAGVGGLVTSGNPAGISAGAGVGSQLGFLFA